MTTSQTKPSDPGDGCRSRHHRARVALVEDHAVVGIGVNTMLAPAGDMSFLGTYPTTANLIVDLEGFPFPDVVLLDLRLPDGSDPADNVNALHSRGAAVIVYTSGDDSFLLRRACEAGVLGVVRKDEEPQVLIDTIRAATRGELTPSMDWAAVLDADSTFVIRSLNKTEQDILALYASGATADFVARRVGLAKNTVNKYLGAIRKKFIAQGVPASSRVDLLVRAQAEGLIPTFNLRDAP